MGKTGKSKPLLKSPKAAGYPKQGRDGGDVTVISAAVGAVLGNLLVPGLGGIAFGGLVGGLIGSSKGKERVMARIPVFYSFHFDHDVMRVQQVRNIGSIEGNAPTSPNQWEQIKRTGQKAVENWIGENMKYKRCVIVLIGAETSKRHWVKYEITKAWNDGRALLGIHIHNLNCPRTGTSRKGKNPFDDVLFEDGRKLSSVVPCYDPHPLYTYQDIRDNISGWIHDAIANKQN